MTAGEELQIIKKVLEGDTNAFEELVLENQNKVYNLALKMLGNEEDAHDTAQEAFIKAYSSLGAFRGESKFSVWLYRLTYNLCIDLIRKQWWKNNISLTYTGGGESEEHEIPDVRNLPEDELLRRETRKHIAEGIGELNQKHREILIMREITGMSYAALAETLGVGEGTVKSRLARARKSLADLLTSKGTFYGGVRLKGEKEVGERE